MTIETGIKPEADSVEVKFVHERSTKNTERYQEVTGEGTVPTVGTLYVQKSAARKLGNPLAITITIKASVTA